MDDKTRLIIAIALSVGILTLFPTFQGDKKEVVDAKPAIESMAPSIPIEESSIIPLDKALSSKNRIQINTTKVKGSINLQGGLIDDWQLVEYNADVNKNSNDQFDEDGSKKLVRLLYPHNTDNATYILSSYSNKNLMLPKMTSKWSVIKGHSVTNDSNVTIRFESRDVRIDRKISMDNGFMTTIEDHITNLTSKAIDIQNSALLHRAFSKVRPEPYMVFEGAMGVINGKLQELKYADIDESSPFQSKGGWVAFSDQYWLLSMINSNDSNINFKGKNPYEIQMNSNDSLIIQPGEIQIFKNHFYVGAKNLNLLDQYEKELSIQKFDLAIDFGWFYFITKPLFYVLDMLSSWLGSFGMAIVVLTFLIKLLTFPLSRKSFKSMEKMKKMGPKIESLKKKYEHDSAKMNQELLAFYQKEKIQPLSGCLPMLVQFPILFGLYKTLMINIGMRQAPFIGWVNDLAAPDPTSLFNLFGLIPWNPPTVMMIGVWPILMGLSMYLQQKSNPQPSDPTQAKLFQFMPVLMTYLFAQVPVGVLIYWTLSNVLTIAQQWLIVRMDRHGK
jgi:YidC/Oxa1 family membrane protein insertase